MAKGEFDPSVAHPGWFGPRSSGLTSRAWFDRELVADTTVQASGAVTFAPMSGVGTAALAIAASGSAQLDGVVGTGAAIVAIAASGAAQLAPVTSIGALVIGDVNITAQGATTFAAMTGVGRLGIGSGVDLREVTIEPRVVELRVTMRR